MVAGYLGSLGVMKVELHPHDDGTLSSFMVDNVFLGRRGFVRVVEKIPGARITRRPRKLLSWFREDSFCEFEINGAKFVAEEPYGDNSSYWVGSKEQCEELRIVIAKFHKQRWPFGL